MLRSEFIMNKTPIKQSVLTFDICKQNHFSQNVGLRSVRCDVTYIGTGCSQLNQCNQVLLCIRFAKSELFLIQSQQIVGAGANAEPNFPNLSAAEMCVIVPDWPLDLALALWQWHSGSGKGV